MLRSALDIAAILHSPEQSKRFPIVYQVQCDSGPLRYGLVTAILEVSPSLASITDEEAAHVYLIIREFIGEYFVSDEIKILVYNLSEKVFSHISQRIRFIDSKQIDSIEQKARRRLIKQTCLDLDFIFDGEKHPLLVFHETSIRRVADTYLGHGDFSGCVGSLLNELSLSYNVNGPFLKELTYQKIFNLVYYNCLLGQIPISELHERFEKYLSVLDQKQIDVISDVQKPRVGGLDTRNVTISTPEGRLRSASKTQISIAIMGNIPEGNYLIDKWTIKAFRRRDQFEDPIFSFVHSLQFIVNGMPMALACPLVNSNEIVTIITAVTESIYCPDLTIDEGGVVNISFDDKYDLKDENYIDGYIEKMAFFINTIASRNGMQTIDVRDVIPRSGNYMVSFMNGSGETEYFFVKLLTGANAFLDIRDRLLSRFEEAEARGSRRDRLNQLAFTELPKSSPGLQRYIMDLIYELIVEPCRKSDLWKEAWKIDSNYTATINEPDFGRKIYHILSSWLLARGISLDREISAAGGSLDFLATCAVNNKIIRCGIELKYAHHTNIIGGLSNQLTSYMEDLDIESGVYLIVWCKHKDFTYPEKYEKIGDLVAALRKSNTMPSRVDIATIDASKKQAPSKR